MVALRQEFDASDPFLKNPPRTEWTTIRILTDDGTEEELLIPFRQPESDALDAATDLLGTLQIKYSPPEGIAKRILEEVTIPQGRNRLSRRGTILTVRNSLAAGGRIDETIHRFHFQDRNQYELLIINSVIGCLDPFRQSRSHLPTSPGANINPDSPFRAV